MLKRVLVAAALCAPLQAYAVPSGDAESDLFLHMVAAVDTDCDGSLSDETPEDRTFEVAKSLMPDECIIYRTYYRNDGAFGIRYLRVSNRIPKYMVMVEGTTEHVETPPGLFPDTTVLSGAGREGELIWRFGGALAPGESGKLQFRVRLDP